MASVLLESIAVLPGRRMRASPGVCESVVSSVDLDGVRAIAGCAFPALEPGRGTALNTWSVSLSLMTCDAACYRGWSLDAGRRHSIHRSRLSRRSRSHLYNT